LLALVIFVGCSDDDTTAVNPPNPPVTNLAGAIGIYADTDGTDNDLVDSGGTVTFYVIHKANEEPVASSAFRIEAPDGWTRIGAVSEYPVSIGDVDTGMSIAYGECFNSEAIHIMTLTYQSPGNSTPGTVFKIVPHYAWPENIQVVNCNLTMLEDGIGEESPVVLP
jgi:hypothetical protein